VSGRLFSEASIRCFSHIGAEVAPLPDLVDKVIPLRGADSLFRNDLFLKTPASHLGVTVLVYK
jgi:hypothetical protein